MVEVLLADIVGPSLGNHRFDGQPAEFLSGLDFMGAQLGRYVHAEARRTALDRVGRDLRTVGAAVERSLAEGA